MPVTDRSRALRRLDAAQQRLERARVEQRAAIVAAHDAGASLRQIAPLLGVSHHRVAQIVREERTS